MLKSLSNKRIVIFAMALIFSILLSSVLPGNNVVSAATTLFSDNFENGSGNWSTNSGSWSIVTDGGSKQYRQNNTTGVGFAYPTNSSYNNWDNYSVEVKMTIKAQDTGTTYRRAAISARYTNNNNRYEFAFQPQQNMILIRKKVNGVESNLASKSYTITQNTQYTVKGVVNGNTLELWVNGVKQLTATDSSLQTGKIALNTYGLSAQYDDVVVSTLDSGPTPTPTPTPAPGAYNVYFGLTHAHTDASASHGDLNAGPQYFEENTPDLHFEAAKACGMDFYFITDHSQYSNTFTPERWNNMLVQANNYTVNGEFVAIRGFEFSENDSPKGHMNIYNTNSYISAADPGVNFPYMYDWLASQRLITPNAIAGFNHPSVSDFNNFGYLTEERREMVTTIEVINAVNPKVDGKIIGTLHYEGFLEALKKGWRVSPRAGGDGHLVMAIPKFTYRTGILATELTRDAILEAMANRRTYATFDDNLEAWYTVNGKIMGSVFTGNPTTFNFSITVSDPDTGDNNDRINKIEILKDNGVVAQTYNPAPSHSVTWNTTINDSTSKYFFVRIWTVGKTDSATAFLAPVWTGR